MCGAKVSRMKRSMQAHEATNCVCEFITEAEDWARKLDGLSAEERNAEHMYLYGFPASIKDAVAVKGGRYNMVGNKLLKAFRL